jgi:hypothetical protein
MDYIVCQTFSDDCLSIVRKDGKYGVISDTNETVLDIIYDYIILEDNDFISVELNKKCGMYDYAGNIVIPILYEEIVEISNPSKLQFSGKLKDEWIDLEPYKF